MCEPEPIHECVEIWQGTLKHLGIVKDAKLDAQSIVRLITKYGPERTKAALFGARLEAKSDNYDPRKNVSVSRLYRKDHIFEKLENLGCQRSEPAERETHKRVGL